MPRAITEEEGLQKTWYETAKTQIKTPDELATFMKFLLSEYNHDYGTICHAMAACALAAVNVLNASAQGGITGFQAGAVFWEFTKRWRHLDGPARLLEYENMLYPQYEEKFNTITPETWKHLQAKAREELTKHAEGKSGPVSPAVVEHWRNILAGHPPFGFTVKES